MSEPTTQAGQNGAVQPGAQPHTNKLLRASIWVGIGALVAAAIVCVVWVLIGEANGMIGKAFLTILLLASFAGICILEANLAPKRPDWFSLVSIISWVILLIIGAFMIWLPYPVTPFYYGSGGFERFMRFLLIVLIVQGGVLHIRLFTKAYARHRTTFTSVATYVTIALVVILAVMLLLPLVLFEYIEFFAFYWRIVVALAILAAVGTAIVPLVNALFAPKKQAPVAGYGAAPYNTAPYGTAPYGTAYPAPVQQWPVYADGYTPLPALPDGSPDWNAYYTGQPTYPQAQVAPAAPAVAPAPAAEPAAPEAPATPPAPPAQGYQGYPPAPPLP